jgi:hypothetical protein
MQKIIVAVLVSAVELAHYFMMGTLLIVYFFVGFDAFFELYLGTVLSSPLE